MTDINNMEAAPHLPEDGEPTADKFAERVYIVDDDSMVRRALYFSLTSSGYSVRPFMSGKDLLDEIDLLEPGCVLLDLRMPGTDGISVLKGLADRVRRFPVVMITGHGEVEVAVEAMKLGAVDFLEKPFTDAALLGALRPLFGPLHAAAKDDEEAAEAKRLVASLTARERELLQGLVAGTSNKGAAQAMGISVRTVEVHRANLMRRLGTKSIADVVRMAIRAGMKSALTLTRHSSANGV